MQNFDKHKFIHDINYDKLLEESSNPHPRS